MKGKPTRSFLRYPIACKLSLTVYFTQPQIGLFQTANLSWSQDELQVSESRFSQIELDQYDHAKIGMIAELEQVVPSEIVKLFSCLNMWSPHISSTLVLGGEMMQFNSKCVGVPTTSQEYSQVLGYKIHCTVEPTSLNNPYHSSVGLVQILDDEQGHVKLSVFVNNTEAVPELVRKIEKIVIIWFKEICNVTLAKNMLSSDDLPFSIDLVLNFRALDQAIDKQNQKLAVQLILHHFQKQARSLGTSFVTTKELNQNEKIKQFALEVPATIVKYYARNYGSQAVEGLETKLKDQILSLLKNQ